MNIEYKLIRAKRKTVAIKIDDKGNVIVRAPAVLRRREIDEIVASHEKWILEHQSKKLCEKNKLDQISPCDEATLKKIAAVRLFELTERYSRLTGLIPEAIKIGGAKHRFGSCSSKKNINFSYRLILYPLPAIEYVVLHELCHLRHMDHSKEFYALVENYMPDWKSRKALLKSENIMSPKEIIDKCKI